MLYIFLSHEAYYIVMNLYITSTDITIMVFIMIYGCYVLLTWEHTHTQSFTQIKRVINLFVLLHNLIAQICQAVLLQRQYRVSFADSGAP